MQEEITEITDGNGNETSYLLDDWRQITLIGKLEMEEVISK